MTTVREARYDAARRAIEPPLRRYDVDPGDMAHAVVAVVDALFGVNEHIDSLPVAAEEPEEKVGAIPTLTWHDGIGGSQFTQLPNGEFITLHHHTSQDKYYWRDNYYWLDYRGKRFDLNTKDSCLLAAELLNIMIVSEGKDTK